MRKIILAATGEELTWIRYEAERRLMRAQPAVPGYCVAYYGDRNRGVVFDNDGAAYLALFSGFFSSIEEVERKAVELGIIRIEEVADTGPQPGPTMQEYLLDEAEAIIKDVARTSSGRDSLDAKRALAFIIDLQNYRSGK